MKNEPRRGAVVIPRFPSKREDDYYEVRIQFSRKAVAVFVALFVALTRLVESLGIELLHSIF